MHVPEARQWIPERGRRRWGVEVGGGKSGVAGGGVVEVE
jgi:hypothetical protein